MPLGVLFFQNAWTGVDQFIPLISTLALTRWDFFFPITLFPRRLVLGSRLSVVITFTLGPQSQAIRFQPQFQWQLLSPVNILSSFSYLVHLSCFLGRLPYSFQVVDQDRRYHLLKIARPFHTFFLVYRLSNVPSMTHRMLSHLPSAFSLRTSVQIRKAELKVV